MRVDNSTVWRIYRTTCLINGKIYIGQTIATGYRWKFYMGGGVLFKCAYEKYGKESFKKDTLIICYTQEQADEYEGLFIELYSSTNPDIGYNILSSTPPRFAKGNSPMNIPDVAKRSGKSRIGRKMSAELKEKLRLSKIGKPRSQETKDKISAKNKLWRPTDEMRRKISEANKGRIVSEETRRKSSESRKGVKLSEAHKKKLSELKQGSKNNRFGVKLSEDTKRKIGDAQRGEKGNNYGKKLSAETIKKMSESTMGEKHHAARRIESYNPETGEPIEKFNAISIAMKKYRGDIRGCLRGKKKKAGGYYWRYSD